MRGNFIVMFVTAVCFLFPLLSFLSSKYWLVLLHYYKNSPPISKSWIRACFGHNHNKTTHVVKKRNFARNSSLKTVRRANLYNFANGLVKSETKSAEIRLAHEEAWCVASDWTYRFQNTWKIGTRHLIVFPLLKLACLWAFVSRLFYQRSTRKAKKTLYSAILPLHIHQTISLALELQR